MKGKLKAVFGIGLTLVLLASLTVGLAGVPAGAASSNLKFTKLELPKVEAWTDEATFADSEGDYWCTPGVTPGPIAQTPDGSIMFAAVTDGTWYDVLKSMDGGYSWIPTGFYEEASDVRDITPIVDIVASPDYAEDTSVFVATMYSVYQSVDGGKNFICMEDTPVWIGDNITDMDVTLDDRGRLAYMVGTAGGPNGDVYVLSTDTGLAWQPQGIGAYDVLACSFSPYFGDDEAIFALVTDGAATKFRSSFSYVGTTDPENGWGKDIGDATIKDAWGDGFGSDSACIGFPDDFDAFGIGNNICFVGVDADEGDVYKIKLGDPSKATDLDIRGVTTTLLPTETKIYSIDVAGDTADAYIMVGVDYNNRVYRSEDGGESWKSSGKEPTGTNAQVLMTPDFLTSKVAYASTTGSGFSAFQRSTDGGKSWNQISLIDYGYNATLRQPDYAITSMDTYGYASDGTLYVVTQVDGDLGALWGRLDGKHWERMFSYANGKITATLNKIKILSDGSAMFAQDIANRTIWRSTDMGATFPKKITTKPDLATVAFVSSTTYYTGHSGGNIYWSTKSGVAWTPPDDSEIPSTAKVGGVSVKGDVVIAATDIGQVFISSDGGKTIERVGKSGPFAVVGPPTFAGTDLGFSANGILYAASAGNPVIMRCEVDLDNPDDAEWDQIDDNQGSSPAYDETNFAAGGPVLCLPPSGILYIVDATAVAADAGGLWRSTNATATAPYFERENKGLNSGDVLGFKGFSMAPPSMAPTFFCGNAAAPYYDQIVMFTDTLNTGVPLAVPEKDATGVGLLAEGYVYPEVTLFWQEMAGAKSYQYQVAIDAKFKTKVAEDFTTSLATPSLKLNPNTTFYWRVRVADEGSILGAPLISPWSEVWKFKTAIGASMARPALQAPDAGDTDVALSPTFEWSGIEWAETYEYELGLDPTTTAGGYFSTPLVALVGTDALVSTAWKCDTALEYTTRYYWHVKAIGVDTSTPWSDVGTFTTMSKAPPPPPTQGPPVVIPPVQQITPAWIWAIVIIGAILVIAVIVLIVTTRRAP